MRTLLRNRLLYFLMATALVLTSCSAKSSVDEEETTAALETEEETLNPSGNDPSGNDVSDNDVSDNDTDEAEAENESEEETEEEESLEEETEEESSPEESTKKSGETDEETTSAKKTSSKETTKASEVTVQSVSASVSGTHYVGETLSGSDFTVVVTMSDGSTKTNPDGWSASPLTLTSTSNLITVSYEGASVTITVNAGQQVADNSVASSSSGSSSGASGSSTSSGTSTGSGSGATTSTTTAAATTAAATVATTTTAAETTTAEEIELTSPICGDREWSYVFAQALFDAQNELRVEAGLDPFIWDDSLYEVAKQCAKACGDAGTIDHDLTAQYRNWVLRTTSDGRTLQVYYNENLQYNGSTIYKGEDPSLYMSEARVYLTGIKRSAGHYAWIISDAVKYSAVAAYRVDDSVNGGLYVSYIFYEGDETYNQGEYYDPETDMWYYP